MQAKYILIALAGALAISLAQAEDAAVPDPAAKVDSGLGELPHHSQWQEPWLYAMPAEKIDSGLGDTNPIAIGANDQEALALDARRSTREASRADDHHQRD